MTAVQVGFGWEHTAKLLIRPLFLFGFLHRCAVRRPAFFIPHPKSVPASGSVPCSLYPTPPPLFNGTKYSQRCKSPHALVLHPSTLIMDAVLSCMPILNPSISALYIAQSVCMLVVDPARWLSQGAGKNTTASACIPAFLTVCRDMVHRRA